jgi:hypothetical protein
MSIKTMFKDKLIKFIMITPLEDGSATRNFVYAERLEVTNDRGFNFFVGDMLIETLDYDPSVIFSVEIAR